MSKVKKDQEVITSENDELVFPKLRAYSKTPRITISPEAYEVIVKWAGDSGLSIQRVADEMIFYAGEHSVLK